MDPGEEKDKSLEIKGNLKKANWNLISYIFIFRN